MRLIASLSWLAPGWSGKDRNAAMNILVIEDHWDIHNNLLEFFVL